MKKGFTLIELLAVIVILAIIALIATPIILGIINDARKEGNERSAELYASAVRNAIASYQLTNANAPTKFSDLNVQYDGNVVCETKELYTDGSFYITDCTVNGTEVEYIHGIAPTRYYSWGSGNVGETLPSDAKTNVSEIDTKGYSVYLGLDVDPNNKVIAAYACFTEIEKEHCLKGNDIDAYETNVNVLKEYETELGVTFCTFEDDSSYCYPSGTGLYVDAFSDGSVNANDVYPEHDANCHAYRDGSFGCSESYW